jgi:hypothetical protein
MILGEWKACCFLRYKNIIRIKTAEPPLIRIPTIKLDCKYCNEVVCPFVDSDNVVVGSCSFDRI